MASVLALLGVVLLATGQCAAAESVRFYKNTNLSGDSDNYDAGSLPGKGACGNCKNLHLITKNSWKSYEIDGPGSIVVYDSHYCHGKSSGRLTGSGNLPSPFQGHTDSFRLCN
ncbi:hypothetical protein COCOBI_07-1030 [Coccomyxa sp. Obi]|nr:hypothetical protein COCOBI_07-1030 [Coccomyxa sp. Obi]